MNLSNIIKLKFPNANLMFDVIIQDDGNGPYIKYWNIADVPQPTQEDLDKWAIEMAPVHAALTAREARRQEYPAIGDQLDMLYKAMDSGVLPKVPDFYNSIKAVKDKFPLSENIPAVQS